MLTNKHHSKRQLLIALTHFLIMSIELHALGLHFDSRRISIPRNAITPLYTNYLSNTAITCSTSTMGLGMSAPSLSIFVNLDIGRLYLYENNRLCALLHVSGGGKATPTPVGSFKLEKANDSTSDFAEGFLFTTPWKQYRLLSISDSKYQGTPTGVSNFSEGDLYLSEHDFGCFCNILSRHRDSSGNSDVNTMCNTVDNITIEIQCLSYPPRELAMGAVGSDVMHVQTVLQALLANTDCSSTCNGGNNGADNGAGYRSSNSCVDITFTPNGIFAEQTRKLVMCFQRKNGLFCTGVVNAATRKRLEAVRLQYII